MKMLLVLNGAPYGSELAYNGLRLVGALAKRDGVDVRVFLMGDAIGCAVAGQQLPDGFYHLDRMVTLAVNRGAEVGLCDSCMKARGIGDDALVDGARHSSLEELADWVLWADQSLTF